MVTLTKLALIWLTDLVLYGSQTKQKFMTLGQKSLNMSTLGLIHTGDVFLIIHIFILAAQCFLKHSPLQGFVISTISI